MESFEQALQYMYKLGIEHGQELEKKEAQLRELEDAINTLTGSEPVKNA